MYDVKLELNDASQGFFEIRENEDRIAEMAVSISKKELTVYHTEVFPQAEGKGLAKKLLGSMVEYAREHQLKVIPLCPYVLAQFNRHSEEYSDVWKKSG